MQARGAAKKKKAAAARAAATKASWADIVGNHGDAELVSLVQAHLERPSDVALKPSVLCAAVGWGRAGLVQRLIQIGQKPLIDESALTVALHAPSNALSMVDLLLRMPDYSWVNETIGPEQLMALLLPLSPGVPLLNLMRDTLTRHPRFESLFTYRTPPTLETPMLLAARLSLDRIVEWLLTEGVAPLPDVNNGAHTDLPLGLCARSPRVSCRSLPSHLVTPQ